MTRLAFASGRALTRVLDRLGDPVGRLEESTDLASLAHELRAKPVYRSITGVLVSADHEVCCEVLKSSDWRTLPDASGLLEKLYLGSTADSEKIDPFLDSIISMDGNEHGRVRRLIQPAFTHRIVQSWRDSAETIARSLLDDIEERSEVDFVEALANPLPTAMICEILGVPHADRGKFAEWGRTLAVIGLDLPRTPEELIALRNATDELTEYVAALLDQRRHNPRDDLLSVLANAECDDDSLTDKEIIATASFLLIAGFETTVNLLSVGTLVLLENRNELRLAAKAEDLVPNLVEEALRFVSPVQYTSRTAARDVELSSGVKVRRGRTIVLVLAGANRDPRVFQEPDSFSIRRENARRNIAFGYGAHHCIGAQLARLEAETLWRELLKRYPDVDAWQLTGSPRLRPGKTIKGLESMPVTFGR
jgi:cytochrome P450